MLFRSHEHIHNHIIVNNVNFYTGHTFETEHNQGKIPDRAWSKLRTISDELCRKHGLSIIENPHLSKGKSHWEWELDKQNLSWKEQLKRTIDEVIKVSEDFEDYSYMQKMKQRVVVRCCHASKAGSAFCANKQSQKAAQTGCMPACKTVCDEKIR